MFWGVAEVDSFYVRPRAVRFKRFIEAGRRVRIEIVQDQHDLLGVRKLHIHQVFDNLREINGGTALGDGDVSKTQQRREGHEKTAHTFAHILVVFTKGMSGPISLLGLHRQGRTAIIKELFAPFIQTNQRPFRIERTLIDIEHVFHGTYEGGVLLGRDAPAFFQPRFEFVFFRVWRTVS